LHQALAQTIAPVPVGRQIGLWKKVSDAFTEPPKPLHPVFRYVMLSLNMLLLVWYFQWRLTLSPDYRGDRYGNGYCQPHVVN
jgi:hypothetical protein